MNSATLLLPVKEPSLQSRIAHCAALGIDGINDRLAALDREWPAGRMVKVTLGVATIGGFLLADFFDPLWLLLPVISGAFLLQYCFFRRSILAEVYQALGFRSGADIDEERLLLRALRGDFRHLPTLDQIEDKHATHRMEDEGGPAVEIDDERYDPQEAAAIIVTAAR